MKNSTKSMILALSAFSTIALSGCGISAKEDFIIDFTYETANGNSVTEEITAQDILDRYLTNQGSTAAEAYYNAIYEVALREVFTNGRFSDKLSDAQADANRDVDEAKDAADTAGTPLFPEPDAYGSPHNFPASPFHEAAYRKTRRYPA